MKVTESRKIPEVFDAVVIPLDDKLTLLPQTEALLPEGLLLPVRAALREKKADGFCAGPYAQDVYDEKLDRSRRFVLIGPGERKPYEPGGLFTPRKGAPKLQGGQGAGNGRFFWIMPEPS